MDVEALAMLGQLDGLQRALADRPCFLDLGEFELECLSTRVITGPRALSKRATTLESQV